MSVRWWTRAGDGGREQANVQALEQGELPLAAQSRLQAATSGAPWLSTLSVPAANAVRQLQVVPVGPVMGFCTARVMLNPAWLSYAGHGGDIRPLSETLTQARRTAIVRLQQEARMLGAHGVVEVRVETSRPDWGPSLLEVRATGTAVRFNLDLEEALPRMFLGNLSAADTLKLLAAGAVPLQWVSATVAYYVLTSWATEYNAGYNREVGEYSQAVYQARELVMREMSEQAREAGADGVLGSSWQMAVEPIMVTRTAVGSWGMRGGMPEGHEDHILHLTVTGTAIGHLSGTAPPSLGITYTMQDPAKERK